MAVDVDEFTTVTQFDQWYVDYEPEGSREKYLEFRGIQPVGNYVYRKYLEFKREADARLSGYEPLESLADARVIKKKPDLPNISSGDVAGLVRRTAKALVQNTPNVEVISKFDDDSKEGIFAKHILTTKIIGSDHYSNDMQQHLIASTKSSYTLGFACVTPALLQDNAGSWYMKYDTIHYRDVYADPSVKDVRDSHSVFVRRYLSREEVHHLIRSNAVGWDLQALKRLLDTNTPLGRIESVPQQHKEHKFTPSGYEIITYYTDSGAPFLTFETRTKMLLRIEQNKDVLHRHPVFFLVLENDDLQPYGKSQVELVLGRQDFQDLMLNGAMKLWYRNINPTILSFGGTNAVPNLGPGKYTNISNPNARIEAFEVNTQTLLQMPTIAQNNMGAMLNVLGTPDQQTASQGPFDGMSATPQGVDAQQRVVDTTTNNFQKAIEGFFSRYCSYALTVYFQELAAVRKVQPDSEAREKLLRAGLSEEDFNEDGTLDIDFSVFKTPFYVRVVPGSLVEMEDEKQIRVLNELFVPLSQALPGLAASQDQEIVRNAALTMQFIVAKQIELSGSKFNAEMETLLVQGDVDAEARAQDKIAHLELKVDALADAYNTEMDAGSDATAKLQEQISLISESLQTILQKVGGSNTENSEQA